MAHVKSVAMDRIMLEAGDVLIELTPDEARRLVQELDELFSEPPVHAPSVMPIAGESPKYCTSAGTNGDYVMLGSVIVGETV